MQMLVLYSSIQDMQSLLPPEEVSDKVIIDLSHVLLSWQLTGRDLGLEEHDIMHISSNYAQDYKEQCYQMMCLWKQRFPEKATYQVLGQALKDKEMYLRYFKIVTSYLFSLKNVSD